MRQILLALALLLTLPVLAKAQTSNCTETANACTLHWIDNSVVEDGVKVERQEPGGVFTQIAVLAPNAVAYVDSTVKAGVTYCYRVRAYNVSGNSDYSNTACGMLAAPAPPPPPPPPPLPIPRIPTDLQVK